MTPTQLRWIAPYGLALALVVGALLVAALSDLVEFEAVALPIFLMAVGGAFWYAGTGPGLFALAASSLALNYFFTTPRYSLYIDATDRENFIAFVLFAAMMGWFAATRRRIEQDLRSARDQLTKEVVLRTEQASLLDLTHDTIFVRGMDDVVSYWNRGAEELFGWTAQQAVGKGAHELLQTQSETPLGAIREELLRTGRWEGELSKVKSDGTRVVVASRWSLRRDEQERPQAILETNNDITEKKRVEERIRRLNSELETRTIELEASNKELEAFAYSTSHDLRAPLRHLVGYTELLQKHAAAVLDEKSRRYVTMLQEAARRMGALIDDLLSFSRIGRAETRATRFGLGPLVREVVAELERETDGRDIVWTIGELPSIHGDRSMLRLAFTNLVGNAIKFTRPRPQAHIEIGAMAGKADEVVVFVRDNGVGFDMKYSNKLFGVFQRLHLPEAFEGTGIGLATVQRIVSRHGGRVWAESAPDKGATFYVSAPKPWGET